jgi:hypothetical protein
MGRSIFGAAGAAGIAAELIKSSSIRSVFLSLPPPMPFVKFFLLFYQLSQFERMEEERTTNLTNRRFDSFDSLPIFLSVQRK